MKERYVVIDLETTGHSVVQGDRIIQIGAIVIEGEEIVERFSSFINPHIPIPPFIEELTGITDEMVAKAPTFHEIIPLLLPMLKDASFVAHNVHFDLNFLQKQLEDEGYDVPSVTAFDTVELARMLLPKQESYKLTNLADFLGFSHDRPHQADSDAEVTAHLFLTLIHKLQTLPLLTLQQLLPISRRLRSDLERLLQTLIHQKGTSGTTDEQQFDCFRQLALKRIDVEKVHSEPTEVPSFTEYKESLMKEGGTFSSAFAHYEVREGQHQMMNEVDEAFHHYQHKLIEAGTGTGKSLAYFIPAAFYAFETGKPVVISTQTIPLQEQLLTRDLPILKKLLPFEVVVALLKGRSHYLCLRKFEQSLHSIDTDTYDVLLTKAQILIWLTETEHGDVEELNLASGGKAFWFEVQSDSNTDLGKYSPWFSRCFYHRARKRAQSAHIIITNHALLFTDLIHEQRLLPAYTHVVIDEAHHLEETASEHLGMKADYLSFSYLLQRLGLTWEDGMLQYVNQLLHDNQLESNVQYTKIEEGLQHIKEELDELFRMIHRYVMQKRKTTATDTGRDRYRYESFNEKGSLWQAILECAMRVHMGMGDTFRLLKSVLGQFHDLQESLLFKDRGFLADVDSVVDSLYDEEQTVYELLLESDPNYVYWIEIEPRGAKNATFLYSKPIDIAERLADDFFAKKKSVILTSATLSVNGSFDYQKKKLGLEDFGAETCTIASPFSYKDQVRLLIPTDIPAIKEVSDEEFAADVAIKVWRIAEETKGKTLVLFTSYEMLKLVYKHVKDLSENESLQLIGQGMTSGSRAKLMKSFKQADSAILFGTSSFWEGVDLPGDELHQLVIVRLPFSPPDQPLLQAQLERAKEEGRNPFMEVSLPQAIIRFKQGFGRLIRTTRDKGCVYVFDRRITTTRYGKLFIRSLPEVPVHEGKLEALLEQFRDF
ncbi:ATP-dependent DNA helicase DinG [Halalkalibacter urbisdiaboli]|uniref:ATP-dependent DNA helicase DinG n=1 Tax=Halalkalibacter urbisdiaboli TaxID=1960589 RepID=UPI000B43B0EF|nr:ATP-dependent DNA helicase DinG [Halalkalibacter urbisdiaboli]